ISLSPALITVARGSDYNGPVAYLQDSDNDPNETYQVIIAWGDDTISTTNFSGGSGSWSGTPAYGEPVYATPGNPRVTVTVVDEGGSMATTTFPASVTDDLTVSARDPITLNEGDQFSDMVATFRGGQGNISGTINWGDGSILDDAIIMSGCFVLGAHQ